MSTDQQVVKAAKLVKNLRSTRLKYNRGGTERRIKVIKEISEFLVSLKKTSLNRLDNKKETIVAISTTLIVPARTA